MELRELLNPYIEGIENSISSENWIVTVMAALTLPDIWNSLEEKKGRKPYVIWFNTYVKEYSFDLHTSKSLLTAKTVEDAKQALERPFSFEDLVVKKHEYLNGVTAYALRCAILHNGDGEVGLQDIYDDKRYKNKTLGIENVKFYSKITDRVLIQCEDTIYLNPKVFCNAILDGVIQWINEKKDNQSVLDNAKRLQIFVWIYNWFIKHEKATSEEIAFSHTISISKRVCLFLMSII